MREKRFLRIVDRKISIKGKLRMSIFEIMKGFAVESRFRDNQNLGLISFARGFSQIHFPFEGAEAANFQIHSHRMKSEGEAGNISNSAVNRDLPLTSEYFLNHPAKSPGILTISGWLPRSRLSQGANLHNTLQYFPIQS